jgi:hypothetical protein
LDPVHDFGGGDVSQRRELLLLLGLEGVAVAMVGRRWRRPMVSICGGGALKVRELGSKLYILLSDGAGLTAREIQIMFDAL